MDSIDVWFFQRGWQDARAGVPLSLSEPAAYVDGWRLYALHYPERVAALDAWRVSTSGSNPQERRDLVTH